jgi:molecular chaperone DnaJ
MIFRLKGKGIKTLRSESMGDLLVEVDVEIPSNLDSAQKDALKKFADSLDTSKNQPACKNFEDKAKKYM